MTDPVYVHSVAHDARGFLYFDCDLGIQVICGCRMTTVTREGLVVLETGVLFVTYGAV